MPMNFAKESRANVASFRASWLDEENDGQFQVETSWES